MAYLRKYKIASEINITPFTDVILVLLIVFMVVTPLLFRSSVNVQLPETKTMLEPPQDITIPVTAGGEAIVDDNRYNLRFDTEVFKFKLKSLVSNPATATVVINGDKKVEYDFVVKVMDIVSQLGVKHIALATEYRR